MKRNAYSGQIIYLCIKTVTWINTMCLPKQPKCYTHQTLVVCCSCVSVLLLLLHVIAFITTYWGVFQITSLGISTTVSYGLWSKCTSVDSDRTVCIDWTSSTSSGRYLVLHLRSLIWRPCHTLQKLETEYSTHWRRHEPVKNGGICE